MDDSPANSDSAGLSAVVFDLDGVVWRDHAPISGIHAAIESATSRGLKVGYLTNNSSQPRSYLATVLRELNIQADEGQVYTAAHIAARYLSRHEASECTYVTIGGGRTLSAELASVGLRTADLADYANADPCDRRGCYIITGHAPNFGYKDVTRLLAISHEIRRIYAAERDRWYASAAGLMPSSAWVVAGIEEVLGLKALTLGKPNALALRTVAELLEAEPSRILMLGDSLEIDVPAAHNAGAICCYFDDPRAGAKTRATAPGQPDFVIRDLNDLHFVLDRLL